MRPLFLGVYTEVYATAARTDPFASPDRFAEGLDHWTARPGWSCGIGNDGDQPVGYAYGAPLPPGSRWWGGLLIQVPADVTAETGTRSYALSELMVRAPWRKTGLARRLHDTLLTHRPEQCATLLVDQAHPKVHALYQPWGWTTLGDLRPRLDDAPIFRAMLLVLPLEAGKTGR
ncbi:GNAT family N-acetyltransferase [Streptomyces sp. NPDC088719]|uniref:GNAT family N-acetyltransferase n=1 Tax=Streptomyces sp. NPDC088719 TaxID=3365872 RepID=UPI0038290D84